MKQSKSNLAHCTVVLIASVCSYLNTLGGGFVFDDTEAVVKNNDLDLNVPWTEAFKNDFWGTNISLETSHKSYRPLTILFYRGIMHINGMKDPFWFHFFSIVLYGTLCLLFYLVTSKIICNSKVAFLTAVLYSVHPLHSEVVCSVVGHADMLSAIMFFLGLYFYSKSITEKSTGCYLITLVLTLAAMLCKETGLTLLGVCSLFDVLFVKPNGRSGLFNRRTVLRQMTIALAVLSLLYLRLYIMGFKGPKFQRMDNPASFADSTFTRVLSHGYIHLLNATLMVWPQWLCFDWAMGCVPLIETLDVRVLYVVTFYLTCGVLTIAQVRGGCKFTMLALVLLTVPFLPASNLFVRVGFVIAERTLLLPSAGFCLLVVSGHARLCRHRPGRAGVFNACFWALCVLFALRAHQRAREWTTEGLFNSALGVCPLNAKVHYNVAKVAVDGGDLVKAEREYREAISLHPHYDQAMNNLANLLRDKNELAEAEALLLRALQLRPDFAVAWMNLGIVLATRDQDERAEQAYANALKHRPSYPDCYYNLGNLYLKGRRHEAALQMWGRAVALRPAHAAAWGNQLVLLDSLGQWDRAAELGARAVRANPAAASLHFTLANTLGKLQRWGPAEHHFLTAIRLSPANAMYRSNLGVLYHRWGQPERARLFYREALRLDPRLRSAADNLRALG